MGRLSGKGFIQEQASLMEILLSKQLANALGATIYVNLEPCNHYGRTPPCSEAWWQLEWRKWWWADPDPRVRWYSGYERRELKCSWGVEENDCRQLNEAFIHRILPPTLWYFKYAMTLDGKIATTSGTVLGSQTKSPAQVHQLLRSFAMP